MNWIFLTLLAAGMESISSVNDRFVLKNDLKNSDTLLVLWGFFSALMFSAPAFLAGTFSVSPLVILIGAVASLCYLGAMHFYYGAANTGEIDRVVPILSLNPVLVLILATLFLGETHEPSKYLGIGLIMLGILVEALDFHHHRLTNKKALYLTILASILFAFKNVLVKWVTIQNLDPLNILCWIGLGILLFNIFITIKLWPRLNLRRNKHWPEIAFAAALTGSVTLIYTAAIIAGPAALVTFLHRIQIFFVFVITETMDFFNPKLLHEKFSKPVFYQKLSGVLVILVGSYLLL